MNVSPSKKDIQEIAIELATEPVFLEKDWHVSRIVESISEINDKIFSIVFCGGTSLLQGYRLINRFSEDADFRIINREEKSPSRSQLRDFRKIILDNLGKIPDLNVLEETLVSRDNSRFFSVMIGYKNRFGGNASLRPEIKLDCTFADHHLQGIQYIALKPIIGDYLEVSIPSMNCLSLMEITVDKASALIWRVLGRNRDDPEDDRTMIRHLHDLQPLLGRQVQDMESIKENLVRTYEIDHKRRGREGESNLSIAAKEVLHTLRTDQQYRIEYENFVINMCFGVPASRITFDKAIEQFSELVEQLQVRL
ncbi:MAG: nucleotidyl transferase AbiEii/AbiGii toxin family protein [Saprospiraceae bacterium]